MKNILKIYKNDLKDIFTNKVLLVIILGLTFLPSLYAWFNIKASWDPYGSTGNISVAVVNNDKGTKVKDENINMGDELVKKLKDDTNLGWTFTDQEKAIEGVKKGTYYASVEIPENFSKDLTSLVSDDVKKGKIIYTVNEKINAIAPKITDKGASTIQNEINKTVVETVSEVIFEISNELGMELENQLPKLSNLENELINVQNKFDDIDKTVNLASDATYKIEELAKQLKKDIPLINSTISNTKNLASNVKAFLQDSKGSLDKLSPVIKNDLQIISQVSSSASDNITSIIDAINNKADNVPALIDNLSSKLSTLSSVNQTLLDFLNKLSAIKPGGQLENVITSLKSTDSSINSALSTLNEVKGQVQGGEKPSLDKLNSILGVVNNVNQTSTSILNNFDSKITNPINKIFEDSFNTADDVITVLTNAQKKLPAVEDILNTTLSLSGNAKDNLAFIKKKLPMAKSTVDELVSAMKKINNSDDVNKLISILKSDVIKRAEFLKQPVELVTEKLYPVANYGAGMTPFYTVLSLWVGVLLLMSLLSTEAHGDYKPFEIYLGRGLIFLTIAIVQAFIVSVGDLYLLKVVVVNPMSFILLSVFTSIVFTAIVYSLVSMFGNVGKAIGVVLLVIQVAASGGTFPIQVTPPFFQYVNPFLPFTYAISALRETVGGIYAPVLKTDIIVLLVFIIIPIIITLLLKGTINKYTKNIKNEFNKSDLTGH